MNKKLKYLIPLLIFSALATSIYAVYLRPQRALNFVIPNLNSLNRINARIENDTAYIAVLGVLENKAPYKIRIDSIRFNLKMEGETFIKERQALHIQQMAGEKDSIDLTFRLPISKMRNIVKGLKADAADSTYITADFEITYQTFLGRVRVPISLNFDIKTPQPPRVKLNKIKYDGLNLREGKIDLALDVKLINENERLEIDISELKYTASFGEYISGTGAYPNTISIKPGETIDVELPINIDYEKPFKLAFQIISNKDILDYEFKIDAVLNNKSMEAMPVSISAKGEAELVNRKRK